MKRGSWAGQSDSIRAEAQDDIIHAQDLVRLGVPEGTVYRRCRGGGWTLLAPATVMLSSGTPTRRQLVRAALVYAGPLAVVTGLDAARAHGLRRGTLPEAVHVVIPAGHRAHSVPGITVERSRRPPTALLRDGLPVAPIARCVLDACRRLRNESDVAAILTEPVQRYLVLPELLRSELDAGTRKGSAVPRAVLRAIDAGVRSAAEFEVHQWWLSRPELPQSVLSNVRLHAEGILLGIADLYLEEVGLVLAVDSVEQHFTTPAQVTETERQHRSYRSAGLHVLGFRPSRHRTDPAALLRDVLDAIAVAAALPRPDVTWSADVPSALQPRRAVS